MPKQKSLRNWLAARTGTAIGFLAVLALVSSSSSAGAVPFVTPAGTFDVGGFELVGTALARSAFSDNVTVHSQGRVEGLLSPSGARYDGAGLNQTYELTYLIGFGETQSVAPNGDLVFALDPANPVNYFELLLDTHPNANSLQGTGFSDGTPVLSGKVTGLASVFTFFPDVEPLDQFGSNDYPGVLSAVASGVDIVGVTLESRNAAAFPQGAPGLLRGIAPSDFPFTFVDPSRQYQTPGGAQLPEIGSVNGADGPDLVLETRINLTFVPEPGTLALLGPLLLALLAWSGSGRAGEQKIVTRGLTARQRHLYFGAPLADDDATAADYSDPPC